MEGGCYTGRASACDSMPNPGTELVVVAVLRALTLLGAASKREGPRRCIAHGIVAVAAHCCTERSVARTSTESVGRVARGGVGRRERVREVGGSGVVGIKAGRGRRRERRRAQARWHVCGRSPMCAVCVAEAGGT